MQIRTSNGNGNGSNGKGIIDKILHSLSPTWAEKRAARRSFSAFLDSAYTGASHTARTMRRWLPGLGSPNTDYGEGTQRTLTARCRDAYRNQSMARAAVDRLKHNVVGTGLRLQSKIDAEFLGISEDEAAEKEDIIEREFNAWAGSQECDTERSLNFYSLQSLALVSVLISGDVFVNTLAFNRPGSPYLLKLQTIEADRVSNNNNSIDTARIMRGVKLARTGAPISYFVTKAHPNDSLRLAEGNQWQEIMAFGRNTGRRRVLHLFEKERPGQVRGIPYLAPILEPLKQLNRYSEAELAAAVIAGFYTVFIKSEGGWGMPPSVDPTTAEEEANQIALDNAAVIELAPGEDISTANPGRPNAQYDPFVAAIMKKIGAALGLPIEFLMLKFEASFSAARASIMQAWKLITYQRHFIADYLCQPVYELFVDELVATGMLQVENYADVRVRRAYTKARWIGPPQGSIKENEAVKAARERVDAGFSNRKIETEKMIGHDWLEVHRQSVREHKKRKEGDLLEQKQQQPQQSQQIAKQLQKLPGL